MYLYVHIPFCRSKCSYCDFFSLPTGKNGSVPDAYIDALIAEAAFRQKLHGVKNWTTVYIGGGTPGLLSASQLKKLFGALYTLCPHSEDAEITFEVNCADIAGESGSPYLELLSDFGINRISAGIQCFNDRVLHCVERSSSSADIVQALENVRCWRYGEKKRRFSCDLIAGLPLLTMRSFREGLLKVLSYKPDHVSLYTLTVEQGTPLERRISSGSVFWDGDRADKQWLAGCRLLEKAGYIQYEVSNFAKKGFESRHNSAYWRTEDYIGIGASAAGTVQNIRYTGTRDVTAYTTYWTGKNALDCCSVPENISLTEVLSKEERITEFIMMGFRMLAGIHAAEFYRRFSLPLENIIGEVFDRWEQRGFAEKNGDNYRLNKKGILFLNDFLTEILFIAEKTGTFYSSLSSDCRF